MHAYVFLLQKGPSTQLSGKLIFSIVPDRIDRSFSLFNSGFLTLITYKPKSARVWRLAQELPSRTKKKSIDLSFYKTGLAYEIRKADKKFTSLVIFGNFEISALFIYFWNRIIFPRGVYLEGSRSVWQTCLVEEFRGSST